MKRAAPRTLPADADQSPGSPGIDIYVLCPLLPTTDHATPRVFVAAVWLLLVELACQALGDAEDEGLAVLRPPWPSGREGFSIC